MIGFKEILAATTDSSAQSDPFDVDDRSRVVRLFTDGGGTLTDDDAFELHSVLTLDSNGNPEDTMPVTEEGAVLMLGANRTQFEVVIRGTYVVQKVLATSEAVGVEQTYGNDEGS